MLSVHENTGGPDGLSLTYGRIDLAAEPEATAIVWVEWLPGRARVRDVVWGVDDAAVLAALAEVGKAGIDCPLGWPDAFLAFITAHQHGAVAVPKNIRERGCRQPLTMRVTDFVVRQETRLIPLSVSSDRIGRVAMRCACLLAQFAHQGHEVSRDGSGAITQVYPAVSLKVWDLPHRGYKRPGDTQTLGKLVDEILGAAPWLDLGEAEFVCGARHDAVDAVVAALTARAAELSVTLRPRTPQEAAAARTKGWIVIPLPDSHPDQLPGEAANGSE